jgi:hypothetical protein
MSMSKSKKSNNESKLAPKYRIQNHAWINVLREKRHKNGRDFKVIITSRNSTTGTGKTTLALWLALNWNNDFTADQATLHVDEYLDIYKEQSKGSVLIMDEAEQIDARRSMSNQNVEFSEKWSMMRYSEVDSILTLPTVTALDKRIEELADVWINVIERGMAKCHLVTVGDYDKGVETPPWHKLVWPDISHLSIAKELERKKERKIAGEIYGNDSVDDKKQDEFEEKYELRLAQRLRDNGKTLREIAEDGDIGHSYSWVYENTSPPEE